MSPINHFYVFVVNQEEEEDEKIKTKTFLQSGFETQKIVPALSHKHNNATTCP
jgi:hypothetical protein